MGGILGVVGHLKAAHLAEMLGKFSIGTCEAGGAALLAQEKLRVLRVAGGLDHLREQLCASELEGEAALGQVQGPLSGEMGRQEVPPHLEVSGRFAAVCAGLVENGSFLREELRQTGLQLATETDTELVAHLVARHFAGDLVEAARLACERLDGAWAVLVLCARALGTLVAVCRGMPLFVGRCGRKLLIATAPDPVLAGAEELAVITDDGLAELRATGVDFRGFDGVRRGAVAFSRWGAEVAERHGFAHHMLKEIHEQPAAIARTLAERIGAVETVCAGKEPDDSFLGPGFYPVKLTATQRLIVVGCGASWHAGLIGRNMIERTSRIPVQVDYAAEFRYRDPVMDKDALLIAVSQSGQTPDTLACVRLARQAGMPVLGIVGEADSPVAAESEAVLCTGAGSERGATATKSFTAQVVAFYLFAIYLGLLRRSLGAEAARRRLRDVRLVVGRVQEAVAEGRRLRRIAERYQDAANFLFLGRGTGYPVALEGALKLHEVANLHAAAQHAAEIRRGPLAPVTPGMPAVVLAWRGRRYDRIVTHLGELHQRGAKVIVVGSYRDTELPRAADDFITIRDESGILNGLLAAVPLQLLAYHLAVLRGYPVDKEPRPGKKATGSNNDD